MAFRFQKRIKLLPGVSINLSKSGVSTSIGPKGAKVTLGHSKVRQTVGLPGTGISHTTVHNLTSGPGAKTKTGQLGDTRPPVGQTDSNLNRMSYFSAILRGVVVGLGTGGLLMLGLAALVALVVMIGLFSR